MANATITGNSGANSATLGNATNASGVPGTLNSGVTVLLTSATVTGAGKFYDVNFLDGNDTLIGSNLPYVNASGVSIGFEDISMGNGNDLVDLTRSGFRNTLDMGSGNDTLILHGAGGRQANMGTGDDRAEVNLDGAGSASEKELAQKAGQSPLSLDGGAGIDTLNLSGDWTLTLSSGNFTLDTNNDGVGDLITNKLTSAQFSEVVGFPALLNGTVQWGQIITLSDGQTVVARTTFSNFEKLEAVCFTAGTRIDTPGGSVAVESLRPGDLVSTRTGPRPLRWVGKRRLDVIDLAANPKLLPIRVPAGAFGRHRPGRDVWVSPQHRLVVRSAIARHLFGAEEVLVAAKHLVGCHGIAVDGCVREVTYCHILLDEHAVVGVEGIEAETLFPGPQALANLSPDALGELRALFSDEVAQWADEPPRGALPLLKGRDSRALAARHARADVPLYS